MKKCTTSRVFKLFILTSLFLSASAFASNAVYELDADNPDMSAACETALVTPNPTVFQDLLTSELPESERFFALLDRGLVQHYRKAIEVSMLSFELSMRDTRENPAVFEIRWPGLAATIIKSQRGRYLQYQISQVKISEFGQDVPFNQRPTGLNGRFAKLMTALTEAVREDIMAQPKFMKVDIVATNVNNIQLVETLRSIGFQFLPRVQAISLQTTGPAAEARPLLWGNEQLASAEFSAIPENQERTMLMKFERKNP